MTETTTTTTTTNDPGQNDAPPSGEEESPAAKSHSAKLDDLESKAQEIRTTDRKGKAKTTVQQKAFRKAQKADNACVGIAICCAECCEECECVMM
jgi:hypothetical protein